MTLQFNENSSIDIFDKFLGQSMQIAGYSLMAVGNFEYFSGVCFTELVNGFNENLPEIITNVSNSNPLLKMACGLVLADIGDTLIYQLKKSISPK